MNVGLPATPISNHRYMNTYKYINKIHIDMYLHLYDIVSTVTFLLGYCKKSTTTATVYSLLHASG